MVEYKYTQSPTGMPFIELKGHFTWQNFPKFAGIFFELLKPEEGKYESVNVVDMHWYNFKWQNHNYRLIFEDFPYEVSIEKNDDASDLSLVYHFLQSLTECSKSAANSIDFSLILRSQQSD